jgi:tetratricopeptide (TPR) repeat protein
LSLIFLARQQTAPPQTRPSTVNRAPLAPASDVAPKTMAPAASEPQPSARRNGDYPPPDQAASEIEHVPLPEAPPASSPSVPSPEEGSAARLTAPGETPPSAQEQRISRLLDDAQRLWQVNKLTLPQGASAYDRYRAVLQMEPQNVVAKQGLASVIERYRQWGKLAIERKQYDKAIGYYQRLLTITKPDAAIYHALGSAYRQAQQYPEAMQAYDKALQLEPNQKQVHQAMATLQTEQITTTLQANDFKHVRANVDADHRLTLSGYVVDDAEEARVLALAQAQPGIEQVINRLENRLEVIIERIQQGSFTSGKL